MTKNTNFVSHKKSKKKIEGKPQLPSAASLVEGEIAINFAKDVETLSIKNESGDVVTFSSDNYYSEKKLGSAFTGANSAVTVTDVIEENEEIISAALTDLNERKLDASAYTPTEELWVSGTGECAIIQKESSDFGGNFASGDSSIALGSGTNAWGFASHSEGYVTAAIGDNSHAEGNYTVASGNSSHAEGNYSYAYGDNSHVEGRATYAYGENAHAEGENTYANADDSHAEGADTQASGYYCHAEGHYTSALTYADHAEGEHTLASGSYSHSEGYYTEAKNVAEHASGYFNASHSGATEADITLFSIGNGDSAASRHNAFEIRQNGDIYIASGNTDIKLQDHLGGGDSLWEAGTGLNSVVLKGSSGTASGDYSVAEGYMTTSSGMVSHAEGGATIAGGQGSHAEGIQTEAISGASHAEGYITKAYNNAAHAEGWETVASGNYSHAEGQETIASGARSHSEGYETTASGTSSHAEGYATRGSGDYSHAEGSETLASGNSSHAEGSGTIAKAFYSHTEGLSTIANNDSEHASGQYNISSSASTTFGDSGNTLFSVGNGTADDARHNAFEIRQNGDIYIASGNTDIKLQDHLGGSVETVTAITPSNSGSTAPIATNVVAENEQIIAAALTDLDERKLDASAYTPSVELWESGTGENSVVLKGSSGTASGDYSVAEGYTYEYDGDTYTSIASGSYSHTEGSGTLASGDWGSHAEGDTTSATSDSSHAEGFGTLASGVYSHAEGSNTTASANYSHAEGANTVASGDLGSHAEGYWTIASGDWGSHAEGMSTSATNYSSHAEGSYTIANNISEHASGQYNVSSSGSSTFGNSGNTLFSVGNGTADNTRHNAFEIRQNGDIYITSGSSDIKLQDYLGGGGGSITVDQTIDSGTSASTNAVSTSAVYGFVTSYTPSITVDQVLDNTTSASTNPVSSKAVYDAVTDNELVWTNAYVAMSGIVSAHTANTEIHVTAADKTAWNAKLDASAYTPTEELWVSGTGLNSVVLKGSSGTASGEYSVAEGVSTIANGYASHAEGNSTSATTYESHAEGGWTLASGSFSHAEGSNAKANGMVSHAEGYSTTANGQSSHAEGERTTAGGSGSHAEGGYTTASTDYSHAEGYGTIANGYASHAEGERTTASGSRSHAEGGYTIANNVSEHASGQYNISSTASTTFGDSGNTLFSIGNGTSTNARHNAFEIRQNGDIYCSDGTNDIKLQDTITATTANTTALGGLSLVKLTQAEYDALVTKDSNTLYVITDN